MTNEMILVLAALGFYFLPATVASCRGHHNRVAILLTNLFFGWTFVGWVVALIWAATAIQPRTQNVSVSNRSAQS